jgi:hypothetical protein
MAVIEITIIVRSSASLERTRGAPRETAHKRQILQPPYNSSDPFRYRILTHVQLSHRPQLLVSLLEEPIAGGEMYTIPAKTIERNRHNPDGRNHGRAPPANYTGEDVYGFALGGGT